MNWNEYRPESLESLVSYEQLPKVADEDKVDVLNKFAIVKLNGGVGSTMGLRRPKALLYIKGELASLFSYHLITASLFSYHLITSKINRQTALSERSD